LSLDFAACILEVFIENKTTMIDLDALLCGDAHGAFIKLCSWCSVTK